MNPSSLLYSKEHEWLDVDGDTATVGITDHAQKELGEIVYVELPDEGDSFEPGDEIGSLESVKAVAEVYIPVSCEVVEVNGELEESPELVNQSPYEDGWLYRIKLTDKGQLDDLMNAKEYKDYLGSL